MKHETAWVNKYFKDTGKQIFVYTLYDLSSMQDYEIEMFAKNELGNSAKTDRLEFKTKGNCIYNNP